MPGEHATLSPSSAERWLRCPGSVRLSAELEPLGSEDSGGSIYAREGTAAHALGELKARLDLGQIRPSEYLRLRERWQDVYTDIVLADDFEITEMDRHTDAYVALIVERSKLYEHSVVMLEQRMDSGVPGCWGTSDTVIVSPVHVEIIDFKYGKGVEVEAQNNPQLRLYGLGALDTFGDVLGDTELVRMTVHQPRLNHVLTEELSAKELRAWRDEVKPIAADALAGSNRFAPSPEACRWCPASGRCRAQLEAVFAEDFDVAPAALSPAEMAQVLSRVDLVRVWLSAFEEAALHTAYSLGKTLPGYKVVRSGGKRSIADPDGAIKTLVDLGYELDEVSVRKVRGIGELEKLLGKKRFAELMDAYMSKGEGRPSLAPVDDPRPAIDPNSDAKEKFDAVDP